MSLRKKVIKAREKHDIAVRQLHGYLWGDPDRQAHIDKIEKLSKRHSKLLNKLVQK